MDKSVKLSPVFVPAINIADPAIHEAISNGTLPVRRGQWVKFNGAKGQFLRAHGGVIWCSWCGKDSFQERTNRFARAVWHNKRKHSDDPVEVVAGAHKSVDGNVVVDWFKKKFARKSAKFA